MPAFALSSSLLYIQIVTRWPVEARPASEGGPYSWGLQTDDNHNCFAV